MSTNCDRCGYRDNEVKSGGAISEKGKRITLRVEDREDLSRDILKVCSFVDGARDCLLMNKSLRVRHVASQSQRSISYFRPEPLEAGSLRWRVSWNRSTKSFLRRSSPPGTQSAAPTLSGPIFRSATSSKRSWGNSKRYEIMSIGDATLMMMESCLR